MEPKCPICGSTEFEVRVVPSQGTTGQALMSVAGVASLGGAAWAGMKLLDLQDAQSEGGTLVQGLAAGIERDYITLLAVCLVGAAVLFGLMSGEQVRRCKGCGSTFGYWPKD